MASTIDSFMIFHLSESFILMNYGFLCMPEDTPDLYQVFLEIYNHHKDRVLYTLQGDSYAEYRSTHDRLVNEKLHSTNEDVQGILSGYCAMVIHALERALEKGCCPQSPSQRWSVT